MKRFCSCDHYRNIFDSPNNKHWQYYTPEESNLTKEYGRYTCLVYFQIKIKCIYATTQHYVRYVKCNPYSSLPFFWPRHRACGILVPQAGIEPASPPLEAWSFNHWTAREVPLVCFLQVTKNCGYNFSKSDIIYIEIRLERFTRNG